MTTLSATTKNAIGMPMLGFGTFQLSVEQAETSVLEAIKAGFRHIDSAQGYRNEVGTGKAIAACEVPRGELFITTKLWPGNDAWGDSEPGFEGTIAACKKSLEELQVDYVDLYLIHAPTAGKRLEQWKAIVEIKKLGLAKYIGVSNYNEDKLKEIEDAGLPMPEANQLEFHPICAQKTMTKLMQDKGIVPIAYSSLATLSTWRSEEGQGGDKTAHLKKACQEVTKAIASRLGVSEAKLLLRWGMQRGYAVLTKSSKPARIRENFDLFGFDIADEDMEKINKLDLALENFGREKVAVEWKPYIIDPRTHADGEDVEDYCRRRWGGSYWINQVKREGLKDGATFANWKVWPNTLKAHQLVHYCSEQGVPTDLSNEALFRAQYEEGRNISSIDTLVQIAKDLGVTGCEDLKDYLLRDKGRNKVQNEIIAARAKHRIRGVPYVVIQSTNDTKRPYVFSGAQDSETLVELLEEVAE